MECDLEELEATKNREKTADECVFCKKGEKFSTSYIDVIFQKVLPGENNQVLIKFKGCPPYSKCSCKDVVQIVNNVFKINYCPMCGRKLV